MKKLLLLFAGLSLLVTTGCNNDNDTIREAPLIGLWQPIKEVVTVVETGEQPVSDQITYSTCQKTSRWWFSNETNGKRIDVSDPTTSGGLCVISPDKNFTYTYDKSSKNVVMKYQGIVEPVTAKVVTLDDVTLNLAVREETQDPTVFKTRTYTFKRVNPQQ
ncbi:lipocalin family protein [Chryseobacterium sp.]|uniref:lipocalin family protein n=1 Tax=Chryseobacterium sp. TaxID=1871047 RepID=UPI0025BA1F04|nr:lipocalin family protein [Chryseobacterium sp.]MBV8328157.1 lipocalin family protein [Chryseobacterium sp.]